MFGIVIAWFTCDGQEGGQARGTTGSHIKIVQHRRCPRGVTFLLQMEMITHILKNTTQIGWIESWLRTQECLFFFQQTQVRFPAPTWHVSLPLVTPAPKDPIPASGFRGNLYSHAQTHTYTHDGNKNKSLKILKCCFYWKLWLGKNEINNNPAQGLSMSILKRLRPMAPSCWIYQHYIQWWWTVRGIKCQKEISDLIKIPRCNQPDLF